MKRLEIAEDLELQRRTWTVERIGWAVFGLTLLAAALGFFGSGVFGDAEARSADGVVTVEYPRFARAHSPLTLKVRLEPASPSTEELRVWIERDYLAEISIEHVTPEPERVELGAERIEYVFAWRGTPGGAAITFAIEAESAGMMRGRIGSGDGQGVVVSHWLYP